MGLAMISDWLGTDSGDYFPSYDPSGNLVGLLNTGGSWAAWYEYDPFGNVVTSGGAYASENPIGFSTQFTDRESGLVYYGLRYYSPVMGRFVSRDPIGEAGGTNLYRFVENDPVNLVDSWGLITKPSGSGGGRAPRSRDRLGDELGGGMGGYAGMFDNGMDATQENFIRSRIRYHAQQNSREYIEAKRPDGTVVWEGWKSVQNGDLLVGADLFGREALAAASDMLRRIEYHQYRLKVTGGTLRISVGIQKDSRLGAALLGKQSGNGGGFLASMFRQLVPSVLFALDSLARRENVGVIYDGQDGLKKLMAGVAGATATSADRVVRGDGSFEDAAKELYYGGIGKDKLTAVVIIDHGAGSGKQGFGRRNSAIPADDPAWDRIARTVESGGSIYLCGCKVNESYGQQIADRTGLNVYSSDEFNKLTQWEVDGEIFYSSALSTINFGEPIVPSN